MSLSKEILQVTVVSPKGLLFNGQAKAVSSFNQKGPFDVLPLHSNFISLIYKQLKILLPEGKEKSFSFQTGVIRVKENKVEVVLEGVS